MASDSAKYYQTHPEARRKKAEYDTKFNAQAEQRRKRVELARLNREHDKKYGKASREGKDCSHTANGVCWKPSSVNRGSKTDMPGDRRARGGK